MDQEFYLVYSEADPDSPFWTRWLDKDLAHVDIWQPVGEGAYLVTRPHFDRLEVTYASQADFDEAQGRGDYAQYVHAHFPLLGKVMCPIGIRTCVTVAKAMLGIRRFGIFTPRQLFNYVEARGGHV